MIHQVSLNDCIYLLIPLAVLTSGKELGKGTLIPLTFSARGDANTKDNTRVPFPNSFPDINTADGISGYIQSFSFTLESESTDVGFTMEFKQANIFP